ncbi:MAG TPA: HD domain-containing protein [Gemmatimonadaceae bacterium]|nr:HD domain-containing protein [Gemmatimonadaceae bacterium]
MTVIRDPLWNNIRVDALGEALIDTGAFQRLRYVRQLGHAFLVYPGATHTRFEHAIGTYHLARRTVSLIEERGELGSVSRRQCDVLRAAALLHDIGHYPFSHALEEIGALDHEQAALPILAAGPVAHALQTHLGASAPDDVHALMRGTSDSPLQGLISGSLDLDKIEYLKRDALMCGVPYGEVDVDRLLHALVLLHDPDTERTAIGVAEKGLAALESLLFAKYQMYRNVYWHHAVRSATAMYKRLVDDALRDGVLQSSELVRLTDEGVLHRLEASAPAPLLLALRERRLHKRALDLPAAELDEHWGDWIALDHARVVALEDAIADELGLAPGELLVDYPAKPQMLGLDIPLRTRDGAVRRLTTEGWPAAINLPVLSAQLYRSARRLRIFMAREMQLPEREWMALIERHGTRGS